MLDFVLSYTEIKTGIAKKYLKYLAPEEISSALRGLVSQDTLEYRYNEGMLVSIDSNKNEIKIFESKEASSIKDDLECEYLKIADNQELIKGYMASQGYVKSTARIVLSQNDFSRFKEGDVLVVSMTRSDYMSLIEKAGAIVTDEGGVSCHATIISRELGKPCVIGTKVATSVIKDGDVVEVRASHGTVRVVRS